MEHRYHYSYFIKPDGKRISARLFYPSRPGERYPLAVFSPGFNTSYRQLEHYGPYFAERGIALLLFDFCGGCLDSESDGLTSEMSVLSETDDLLFLLSQLRRPAFTDSFPADPDRIFLMGESQGGYVSLLAAGRQQGSVKGLVLWYPAFCLQDMALAWRQRPGGFAREMWSVPLGRMYTDDAADTDIYGAVQECTCPAVIIHGDDDRIVPLGYSEKAVSLQPLFRLEIIPGAGHGFENEERITAADASIRFIKDML